MQFPDGKGGGKRREKTSHREVFLLPPHGGWSVARLSWVFFVTIIVEEKQEEEEERDDGKGTKKQSGAEDSTEISAALGT